MPAKDELAQTLNFRQTRIHHRGHAAVAPAGIQGLHLSRRFRLEGVRDLLAQAALLYDGKDKRILASPEVRNGEMASKGSIGSDVALHFVTPTRIRHKGDYILFRGNREFPAPVLLENLYRRAYLMTFSHCCDLIEPFRLPDSKEIKTSETDLRWQDWERYSNRQQRRHHFGGFVGRLALRGGMGPWLPLLKAGEVLHAGSATSFGLGKFEVVEGG